MSRKITVVLIFFLFLLPFVSWYYLQSGLTWRKKAQEVLHGTEAFPMIPLQSLSGVPMEKSELENHVSLVALVECDSIDGQLEFITKLYSQFKETRKANFIFIDTCREVELTFPDSLSRGIYTMGCNDSLHSCAPLLETWPSGKLYALLDKTGTIRAYYQAKTQDQKQMLVEHMALLLPRDHGEKVQLKREVEKR
jgi:predicted metal-binding protein